MSLPSLVVLAAASALAADMTISNGTLQVKFNSATRTLELSDTEAGPLLGQLVVEATVDERVVKSDQAGVKVEIAGEEGQKELILALAGDVKTRVRVIDGNRIELRTDGSFQENVYYRARAEMGPRPLVALLEEHRSEDRRVLVTTYGPAEVRAAQAIFDPQRDLALSINMSGLVAWQYKDRWQLFARTFVSGAPLVLQVERHYYRDRLGIKHYAPLRTPPRWPTAPVVAMTWYGIEGWKNKPAQRKEWLYPNVDWVAKHLLPYAGGNLVFQLDDNYAFDDDKYMRELSDYIRSKGLIPGIWFTPFVLAPPEVAKQHPEWFLHDAQGKLLAAFGGVNWGGNSYPVLNAGNAAAVKNWYGMFWHKVSDAWNFDFFKIDGQPGVIDAYRKAVDGGGIDAYRKGLELGRSIVGPEKFINACWGTPVEAIGRVNGSRTGGDTGNDPHAVNVILHWNFLNNVCWWSDPDAAANLHKATVERTRLNAQARALTGQQFLTDDVWTEVKPEICRVWQCSFPVLDIRPATLYPITDWRPYDLFDLRVAKPWGSYDVVGLFNYDGQPAEKVLELGRLKLEAEEVHVLDRKSVV
jgi:hypothetical protein